MLTVLIPYGFTCLQGWYRTGISVILHVLCTPVGLQLSCSNNVHRGNVPFWWLLSIFTEQTFQKSTAPLPLYYDIFQKFNLYISEDVIQRPKSCPQTGLFRSMGSFCKVWKLQFFHKPRNCCSKCVHLMSQCRHCFTNKLSTGAKCRCQ